MGICERTQQKILLLIQSQHRLKNRQQTKPDQPTHHQILYSFDNIDSLYSQNHSICGGRTKFYPSSNSRKSRVNRSQRNRFWESQEMMVWYHQT